MSSGHLQAAHRITLQEDEVRVSPLLLLFQLDIIIITIFILYNKKIFFRLIFYLVPVVLVSVGLNLTKFFETEIVTSSEEEEVKYEIFESKNINITLSSQVECKVKTGPTFIIFMI